MVPLRKPSPGRAYRAASYPSLSALSQGIIGVPAQLSSRPGTLYERVDQVGPPVPGRSNSPPHGWSDLVWRTDLLALDSKSAGHLNVLHIRITKVAEHVFLFLGLTSSLGKHPHASFVVTSIIKNDDDDRNIVPGSTPEGLYLTKQEPSISCRLTT